eukprot:GGOE01017887.1.p1 GENE.GGOE01017887.1~~GGOE01017887.1.p1  ORF type:complete len:629 (+),score=127.01 GGOE01017887.1:39-1889(+)
MFTGLVQAVGVAQYAPGRWQLTVTCEGFFADVKLGDSISINGACMTVVEFAADWAKFDVMEESRKLTNLQDRMREQPTHVNLEKSMKVGDGIGGHMVSGHVDGTTTILELEPKSDGSLDVWIDLSPFPSPCIMYKGSVTLDGCSLTVAEVAPDQSRFRVSLIPHTQTVTILGKSWVPGYAVNLEFDHAMKASSWRGSMPPAGASSMSPPASYSSSAPCSGSFSAPVPADVVTPSKSLRDEHFMYLAIAAGEKGRYTAAPNPWVGCVVVKDGVLLGTGFHVRPGMPHAEPSAFTDALGQGHSPEHLAGSTVYVTLEPCSHYGRTPPCVLAILERRCARVVVGVMDPDPHVAGSGLRQLRDAGVEVAVGVCAAAVAQSLAPYLHQRRTGRPFVCLKAALTLDGAIACADGTSQWITGKAARADAHMLRAASQAILVGSGTALADRPQLTVRTDACPAPRPLRVLLDGRGRVTGGPLLDLSLGPTLIFTVRPPPEAVTAWQLGGVEVITTPDAAAAGEESRVSLDAVLAELGRRGVLQLLVEGGAAVASSFLTERRVDLLRLYYGATMLGAGSRPWITGTTLAKTIQEAQFWKLTSVRQVGNDACLEYGPAEPSLVPGP